MQSNLSLSKSQITSFALLVMEILFVFGIMVMASHAHAQSGNVYDAGQRAQTVLGGTVVSIREVQVNPSQRASQVGTATGAAMGGAIGYALARNTSNSAAKLALGILGAGLGGLGGAAVTEHVGHSTAVEIVVAIPGQRDSHRLMAVVQPLPGPQVSIGQAVLVLNDRGTNRIIPQAQPLNVNYAQQAGGHPMPVQAYPVATRSSASHSGYVLPAPYESAD